ncbi:hypothetical protein FSP39_022045 [Pinctada imbricata]|uniref:Uncharacterized protein n=1 Tax=Pinctada imbricata TaxID=66713 RepID=A0AA88Y9V4_PINIB|nr:hypothetical protein FSP39_022045 [Pinctada imbricata]
MSVKGVKTRLDKTKDVKERSKSEMNTSTGSVADPEDLVNDIKSIKENLKGVIKKEDLESALNQMVQKSDMKDMVTVIVKSVVSEIKESISKEVREHLEKEFDEKLREKTGVLNDKIDGLEMEAEGFREKIEEQRKEIKSLKEELGDVSHRSKEAMCLANFNEQYSRKNNVKILNWKEEKGEDLRKELIEKVKEVGVEILPWQVNAIHRIPGKKGGHRPVIVKLHNSEIKRKVMVKRKELRNKNVKVVDDVTSNNMALLTRLSNHRDIVQSYYFNGHIYGKTEDDRKIRFDLLTIFHAS